MMNDRGFFLWVLCVIIVIAVQVSRGTAQSYFLAVSQNQENIYSDIRGLQETIRNRSDPFDPGQEASESATNPQGSHDSQLISDGDGVDELREEKSSRGIFLFKNLRPHHQTDFSQTTMDVVTIVWYVATFFALAAFFLLMACSDRRRQSDGAEQNNSEGPLPPPTPSPSYTEFAPPSYETVMKLNRDGEKYGIFVIPFPIEDLGANKDNEAAPQTPNIHVQTVNELQKPGS